MADLNALIAQGAQFRQAPDPFVQYGQMQQLEQNRQANQLNRIKMEELQATAAERNALRQLNPSAPDYESQLFRVNPTIGIAYRKEASLAAAQKTAAEKQNIESAKMRQGMLGQAFRDISSRPSDANITAHMEDVLASTLFSPEEKSRVQKLSANLLSMPVEERGSFLSSQGATAGDISTAATAKAGQGVTMRGQDLTAGTAAAGQGVTMRGQDITAGTAARGQDLTAGTAAAGQGVTIRGQDIVAGTAARGQDLTASTAAAGQGVTARGQDIVAKTAAAGQGVTARGQDIVAATAAAGQGVTRRGQDIVAKTAAAGQDVTMRGQNLLNARESENLAIRQEDQRRAGDPAFQQKIADARAAGANMAKDRVLRTVQLPKVIDTADMTLGLIDSLIGKRDAKGNLLEGQKPHPGFSSVVGFTFAPGLRFVPGTDAADFQSRLDQVKGGSFLQAYETLKGGGQITNIEGEKGTLALNRMQMAQSEKEFITAAREFQGIVKTGVERAKKLTGSTAAASDPLGIR